MAIRIQLSRPSKILTGIILKYKIGSGQKKIKYKTPVNPITKTSGRPKSNVDKKTITSMIMAYLCSCLVPFFHIFTKRLTIIRNPLIGTIRKGQNMLILSEPSLTSSCVIALSVPKMVRIIKKTKATTFKTMLIGLAIRGGII